MSLYFSRHTKVYMEQGANVWEIPVMEGFSFSQGTNSSEVVLNEMESTTGVSRRGRQMFNDSYAPAEWSFTTYVRPFLGQTGAGNWEPTVAAQHAVEEALWANFVAANSFTSGTGWADSVVSDATDMNIDFLGSNVAAIGEFDLYFVLGDCSPSGNGAVYKIEGCVIDQVSADFEIDGIAQLSWSGMGNLISDVTAGADGKDNLPATTINEALSATNNFIRNRLTTLSIQAADTAVFPGAATDGVYNVVLTGGNVTFANNITFLTPEILCSVNQPFKHVTGTRNIGGNFTCYLSDGAAGESASLFKELIEASDTVTNSFALGFSVGGVNAPNLKIDVPNCHMEVPAHSIEDVVSLEVNFHALPTDLDTADEAAITYTGIAYV